MTIKTVKAWLNRVRANKFVFDFIKLSILFGLFGFILIIAWCVIGTLSMWLGLVWVRAFMHFPFIDMPIFLSFIILTGLSFLTGRYFCSKTTVRACFSLLVGSAWMGLCFLQFVFLYMCFFIATLLIVPQNIINFISSLRVLFWLPFAFSVVCLPGIVAIGLAGVAGKKSTESPKSMAVWLVLAILTLTLLSTFLVDIFMRALIGV